MRTGGSVDVYPEGSERGVSRRRRGRRDAELSEVLIAVRGRARLVPLRAPPEPSVPCRAPSPPRGPLGAGGLRWGSAASSGAPCAGLALARPSLCPALAMSALLGFVSLFFFSPLPPPPPHYRLLETSLFIAARNKGSVPCLWISSPRALTVAEICGLLFLASSAEALLA